MLGKVMKYELISNGRPLLPMFGLSLVLSVFFRFLLWLAPKMWDVAGVVLGALVGMLGSLLPAAIVVVAFAMVVMRFYRSMTGPEAYLSFTLPVSVNTHLISRILVSTLYMLLATGVAVVCSYIFLPGFELFSLSMSTGANTSTTVTVADMGFGAANNTLVIVMLVLWVGVMLAVSYISAQVMVFHAISLSVKRSRNRALVSVLAYFALSAVSGIVSVMSYIGIGYAWFESGGMRDFALKANGLGGMDAFWHLYGFLWAILGIMALVMGVIAVLEYLHMRYMFAKKLNLE